MQVCRQATVKVYYMSVRSQLYCTGRNPRGTKEDFENSVNLKIREGAKNTFVSQRGTACTIFSNCGQHTIILTNILVGRACSVVSGIVSIVVSGILGDATVCLWHGVIQCCRSHQSLGVPRCRQLSIHLRGWCCH